MINLKPILGIFGIILEWLPLRIMYALIHKDTIFIWLVVSTPLKKYESQLGWLFSIYGKIKTNKPPTISMSEHVEPRDQSACPIWSNNGIQILGSVLLEYHVFFPICWDTIEAFPVAVIRNKIGKIGIIMKNITVTISVIASCNCYFWSFSAIVYYMIFQLTVTWSESIL